MVLVNEKDREITDKAALPPKTHLYNKKIPSDLRSAYLKTVVRGMENKIGHQENASYGVSVCGTLSSASPAIDRPAILGGGQLIEIGK